MSRSSSRPRAGRAASACSSSSVAHQRASVLGHRRVRPGHRGSFSRLRERRLVGSPTRLEFPPTRATDPRWAGGRGDRLRDVSWDFSTEPEFEEKLAWMRDVRPRGDRPARDARPRPRGGAAADRAAQGGGAPPGPLGRPPRARARRRGLRPGASRADARDPRGLRSWRPPCSATRRPTRATRS